MTDCNCLQALDRLRLKHEEGKVDAFVAVIFEKDNKQPLLIAHQRNTAVMARAMIAIAQIQIADLESEE
jgi:hypothetical protein